VLRLLYEGYCQESLSSEPKLLLVVLLLSEKKPGQPVNDLKSSCVVGNPTSSGVTFVELFYCDSHHVRGAFCNANLRSQYALQPHTSDTCVERGSREFAWAHLTYARSNPRPSAVLHAIVVVSVLKRNSFQVRRLRLEYDLLIFIIHSVT
jgi:hypothetical protein